MTNAASPRERRVDERQRRNQRRYQNPADCYRVREIHRARAPSGERLQHQLADRLERVEDTVAVDCDSLEIRRPLDPSPLASWSTRFWPAWYGSGVTRAFAPAPPVPIPDSAQPARSGDRCGVWQIALVVLNHERHPCEIVAVFRHVVVQILHRFQVRFHALDLRVGDENDSVNVLEDELSARVVVNLAGHRVEMEAGIEPANCSEVDRQEIEEKSSLGFCRQRDELSARIRLDLAVDVLEVGRLAARVPARSRRSCN